MRCFYVSVNVVLAIILLFAYSVPWLAPKDFPLLSVGSVFIPIFLVFNILYFLLSWVLSGNSAFILIVPLLLGGTYIGRFVRVFSDDTEKSVSDVNIMTFNVRLFNRYHWSDDKQMDEKITTFICKKYPDILVLQEFYSDSKYEFALYPYRYVWHRRGEHAGLSIFSKFPIVGSGSLDFQNTSNNAIYADIKIKSDTIRVYNLHLESLHINPEKEQFSQQNLKQILNNVGNRFVIQQKQVEIYQRHQRDNPYKSVVCGDFNNTAFSYVYRQIKTEAFQDSFDKASYGFWKTFSFLYFPFRIDYILVDNQMPITSHTVFYDEYSDHYPVMASFKVH